MHFKNAARASDSLFYWRFSFLFSLKLASGVPAVPLCYLVRIQSNEILNSFTNRLQVADSGQNRLMYIVATHGCIWGFFFNLRVLDVSPHRHCRMRSFMYARGSALYQECTPHSTRSPPTFCSNSFENYFPTRSLLT